MTKEKSKRIAEEKEKLAYHLLEVYGNRRVISLFEHLTGRKDLRTANIFCLYHMLNVFRIVDLKNSSPTPSQSNT